MSLPSYPRSKKSGVEWLGEVPEHWRLRRIRFVFQIRKRISGSEGYDVLSITQQGIKIKDLDSNDGQLSMDYSKYQFVEVGDFAMNHMDLLTGYVDISKWYGVTSPDYRVFSIINPEVCHDIYFLYLFQNAYKQRIFYPFGQGSSQLGRWRLPTEEFKNFVLPLPPFAEQSAIAIFLNRETGKIDALIQEQKRLLESLKEKRQAVISHAVTKGLNPDAQFRGSGIKWVGLIPSGWSLSRVKYVVSKVVDCLHSTPTYEGDLIYPAIRTADIQPGRLLLDQARLVSEDVYRDRVQRLEPEPGDILYSREGSCGIAALVPPNTKLCLGQRMMMFRTKCSYSPSYMMWALNSSVVYQQVLEGISGPTAPHVNIADVINYAIPLPEQEEQEAIAAHIDLVVEKIDELISFAEKGIDLLQERRIALISSAVTGKIDVRAVVEVPTA